MENNGLLKNIRDSLNDYEAKLQDLRSVLQEAAAQGKQATGLNHENEGVLGAIQVSHRQEPPAFVNGGDEGNQENDPEPGELFYLRPPGIKCRTGVISLHCYQKVLRPQTEPHKLPQPAHGWRVTEE